MDRPRPLAERDEVPAFVAGNEERFAKLAGRHGLPERLLERARQLAPRSARVLVQNAATEGNDPPGESFEEITSASGRNPPDVDLQAPHEDTAERGRLVAAVDAQQALVEPQDRQQLGIRWRRRRQRGWWRRWRRRRCR